MQSTTRTHITRAIRARNASPRLVSTQARRTIHSTSPRTTNNNPTNSPIMKKAPSPFPIVQRNPRIVVGVTGATGTVYAIRLLEILRALDIETHLILSKWAQATMKYETDLTWEHLHALATHAYAMKDVAAPPSSGSFLHDGMIVVPCSMKTLAAVRAGYCDDLISRSADVSLKEGRRLVMVVRETPLSAVHLDNMAFLQRAGATIFPPVPAFYTRPKTIADLVDQSVGRMLDSLGIHVEGFERWEGMRK
ncbi:3-octaprenyl-4-hydroxybenzoate carboxy-lyase [Diplodia corticola]|uniref:Flavin prenyltransferase PAD1, mitochondrial n=1 Tax=Diplodia corticola TaxID=236234 RepID=A0A1J9QZI9_9PEZI|nr:3-octaprenyl-4-hydroxybenzoate carboxy-lyase [Diplodia corticola]OJD33785.1 3-octaprenyl-4-hydroxybenzoate carboxy-lyase [Diplodia corticola]